MSAPVKWLTCGVLRPEMEELGRQGKIGGRMLFLDSMLHMTPQRLESLLTASLERGAPEGRGPSAAAGGGLVLVYGDCCPRMQDLAKRFGVRRVRAVNCAQLLTGRTRYRELMRDEAFMLLPEWALRWSDVMRTELGLSEPVVRDLMGEHRRMLVYLDTGLAPVPREAMEECSAYTGLPWRVETVTLDHLLAGLREAEEEGS